MKKRRRGTVVVESAAGIVLVRMKGGSFMLPGGQAEAVESRAQAAIRELKEEADLGALSVIQLFEHESKHYAHKVFYVVASGVPRPSSEIDEIAYFTPDFQGEIGFSSRRILEKFRQFKASHRSFFAELSQVHSAGVDSD